MLTKMTTTSSAAMQRKEAVSFSSRLSFAQTVTLLVIAILTLIVQPLFGGFGTSGIIAACAALPLVFHLVDIDKKEGGAR